MSKSIDYIRVKDKCIEYFNPFYKNELKFVLINNYNDGFYSFILEDSVTDEEIENHYIKYTSYDREHTILYIRNYKIEITERDFADFLIDIQPRPFTLSDLEFIRSEICKYNVDFNSVGVNEFIHSKDLFFKCIFSNPDKLTIRLF
jgi:hypothetical protein